MTEQAHRFVPGDRVHAPRRAGFPHGTVVTVFSAGLVLVRWDGDVLETADPHEIEKIAESSGG